MKIDILVFIRIRWIGTVDISDAISWYSKNSAQGSQGGDIHLFNPLPLYCFTLMQKQKVFLSKLLVNSILKIVILVFIRNRLTSGGLERVLIHTKKIVSSIVLYQVFYEYNIYITSESCLQYDVRNNYYSIYLCAIVNM